MTAEQIDLITEAAEQFARDLVMATPEHYIDALGVDKASPADAQTWVLNCQATSRRIFDWVGAMRMARLRADHPEPQHEPLCRMNFTGDFCTCPYDDETHFPEGTPAQ